MATIETLDESCLALLDTDVTEDDVYQQVAKKSYARLMVYRNVQSNSQDLTFHACPRKWFLNKHKAQEPQDVWTTIDFAFGHAVGSGVQSYLVSKNATIAQFNAFMAWAAPFYERIPKKKKSIWEAGLAVEKFIAGIEELLDDWELFVLPSGRPAVEVSFSLDTRNGYKHYGHIDGILRNKATGVIAVLELKTTGLTAAEEAIYANSSQALGYAIILDTLFPGLTDYQVFYGVYSSTDREWNILPFPKNTNQKAEWIRDILIDDSLRDTYHKLNFYPKRGESCFDYMRRCEYFGICNVVPDEPLEELQPHQEAEHVDYALDLHAIVKAQQEKL